MAYVANKTVTVNCIYGTYTLIKDAQVNSLVANKFPQHVNEIEDEVEIVQELPEENKIERKKG